MNLTNKQVVHSTFGKGQVKSVENGRIAIEFEEGIGRKAFQYPASFEHYLKMCEAGPQETATKDLNELLSCVAIEKAEKEREYQERQQLLREERLEIRKAAAKKTAAKKPATKKAAVKKIVIKIGDGE